MRTLLVFVVLVGCATIPAGDKALLVEEPDCTRSADQIAALEKAKPTDLKRAQIAVQYVSPAGWIGGAVNKDFADRKAVLNGDYAQSIDTRIAEIKVACPG